METASKSGFEAFQRRSSFPPPISFFSPPTFSHHHVVDDTAVKGTVPLNPLTTHAMMAEQQNRQMWGERVKIAQTKLNLFHKKLDIATLTYVAFAAEHTPVGKSSRAKMRWLLRPMDMVCSITWNCSVMGSK